MKGSKCVFISSILVHLVPTSALIAGNIKIVGQPGGIPQFLPGSYINTIPRWIIESSLDEENTDKQSVSLKQLIGSGLSVQQYEGGVQPTVVQSFVNPTTNEELWWPSDIKTIQIRPTLDIFIKSASPAYLLAGVEVRVPPSSSKDGKEWKNFGINSQPLATQWTSFGMLVEQEFRIETFVGKARKGDGDGESNDSDEDAQIDWEPLYGIDDEEKSCYTQKNEAIKETSNAVQTLGDFLAEMDEKSPLATGMHILSIPISSIWRDMPSPNLKKNEKISLVSVGTVEPDAMELLSVDDDLIAMSATSLLNVDVQIVAPGSESEYIPDVYKPLYLEMK